MSSTVIFRVPFRVMQASAASINFTRFVEVPATILGCTTVAEDIECDNTTVSVSLSTHCALDAQLGEQVVGELQRGEDYHAGSKQSQRPVEFPFIVGHFFNNF